MGIEFLYYNQSNKTNTIANKSLYFGDVYREPKRKRCFSNEQLNPKNIAKKYPNLSKLF